MIRIKKVTALEILDSRGNPTVEVTIELVDGSKHRASVPSGASTGEFEAHELRDNDPQRYHGKGVKQAVKMINTTINYTLQDKKWGSIAEIDQVLLELDDTPNKTKLGANSMLGVSIAATRALAHVFKTPVYKYIQSLQDIKQQHPQIPIPLFNIFNGGAHADNNLSIQEYMIIPHGIHSYAEQLRAGSEIYHQLKKELIKEKLVTGVGDEGGFAPSLKSDYHALELIMEAINDAGYEPQAEISIGLDVAIAMDGKVTTYDFSHQGPSGDITFSTANGIIDYYDRVLTEKFPIILIEDGLDDDDWAHWPTLTQKLKNKGVLSIGDDFLVTNPARTKKAAEINAVTGMIIKPNQIGTVSEVLETAHVCDENNLVKIASHRSGETTDTFIAHLAVGIGAQYLKDGAPCRGERVDKYNELLRIDSGV